MGWEIITLFHKKSAKYIYKNKKSNTSRVLYELICYYHQRGRMMSNFLQSYEDYYVLLHLGDYCSIEDSLCPSFTKRTTRSYNE